MLRLLQVGNALPYSWPVDPSAEFMPGMCAELTVLGNQIVATVSNGTAPIGIIDDINTKAFSAVSWNETVKVVVPNPVPGQLPGQWVTPTDIKVELQHANIAKNSFISTVEVQLIPRNGIVVFLAGTPLNVDLLGTGYPNGVRTIVNYTYQVPNIPGDNSTIGSGRMTVWYNRMFFQTDQMETNVVYPVKANLYCSETGLFTTRKPSPIHPAVAMVTGPPTSMNTLLEAMWF